MEIVRISTAGSVDDGKSTLIGRLLYDTHSLPKDKIEAVRKSSRRKGLELDLSLFTDGLIAEREQGITIDVAHIYFSTQKRKYIIADTPGHVEYTRNMITGASTAQVAVILIDARTGITAQTKRHFYISTLLRIPNVIVTVNKMDLVDYREDTFYEQAAAFQVMAKDHAFDGQQITIIPVSALNGDNIAARSANMKWYTGPVLLEYLESVSIINDQQQPSRFPVQYVIRPMESEFHDYRGYAGRVESGTFHTGQKVTILPSGATSVISGINRYEGAQDSAGAGESVTLLLEDDIDISRGSWIVPAGERPAPNKGLKAKICWLDSQPGSLSSRYTFQSGPQSAICRISEVSRVIDPDTLAYRDFAGELSMNDMAEVSIQTASPVFVDPYSSNPSTGSFILVDTNTNNTVAVGFVN